LKSLLQFNHSQVEKLLERIAQIFRSLFTVTGQNPNPLEQSLEATAQVSQPGDVLTELVCAVKAGGPRLRRDGTAFHDSDWRKVEKRRILNIAVEAVET
jgi:hypothetical protein